MRLLICVLILLASNNGYAQPQIPLLLEAIKANDGKKVGELLLSGTDITVVDADGDNCLMYAAFYSTPACMELLLKAKADPNKRNALGETALMWCPGDISKTQLLLEHGANPNLVTSNGNTALLIGCLGTQKTPLISLLLRHGADPKAINNKKFTAFHRVAAFGDTTTAMLFLGAVDINETSADHETAIYEAVRAKNLPMIRWFLEHGADVNVLDSYKSSLLAQAVMVDDINIVRWILPFAKNINGQDVDGITTLMWAVYNEHDNPEIVRALLDAGADLSVKDKNGLTALDWAKKKGATATVALLANPGIK
jgi:ankyrin repeat protein